jgi:hypothetical protein
MYFSIFSGNEDIFLAVNEKLYYINGIFYYLSSTINPVIYNLMSAKYRRAFLITIANCCGRKATRWELVTTESATHDDTVCSNMSAIICSNLIFSNFSK